MQYLWNCLQFAFNEQMPKDSVRFAFTTRRQAIPFHTIHMEQENLQFFKIHHPLTNESSWKHVEALFV